MRIEDAADVFCRSFTFTRSFNYPFEFVRIGGLRVMRDAVKKPRPRVQEIIVCGLDTDTALKEIRAYEPPQHFVCAISKMDEDREAVKRAYKAAGYRAIGTEDFFVRDLTKASSGSPGARRVSTLEEADQISKVARGSQIPPKQISLEKPEIRLYGFWRGESVAGWVRSIHLTPESTWVSNLHVLPAFRRQGVGSSLMNRMLDGDREAGAAHSVLLASRLGSMLYPHLGYEQIGVLQMFAPIERDS